MGTPLTAMLWELWRTSRLEILVRMGGQCVFILLFCGLAPLHQHGSTEAHEQVIRGIALLLLASTSLFSTTWLNGLENRHVGFSFRLGFTRPISTIQLVVVPMLYSIVVAIFCFVVPALLIVVILELPMPLLGPAALVACLVSCLIAAAWFPTTILGRAVGLTIVAIGIIAVGVVFNSSRDDPDPILLAMGKLHYFDFSWPHYASFLAVSAAAVVTAVVGVERQRHGDHSLLEGLASQLARRLTRAPGDDLLSGGSNEAQSSPGMKPFRGPVSAQCWYEARRFGQTVLLLGALAPLLPLAFVCIVPWVSPGWDASPVVWLVTLMLCPFVYQLVGVDGAIGLKRKQGDVQFSTFDATRALPNDQLIAIKLVVIAACSLFGWLCMGLTAGLHTVASGDWQAWSRVGEALSKAVGVVPVFWWIAGLSNVVLLYISSTSILLAFGLWLPRHRKLFSFLALASYTHMVLAVVDIASDSSFWYLWRAYGYLTPPAIVAGSIFALSSALSTGQLGIRLFAGACCLWVLYVVSTMIVFVRFAPANAFSPMALVFAGSTLLIPLAATAFAPLAIASHRHA